MPVTTKRAKVKLPFFTFQVPVGWEAKPLTPAQKKKRKADKEKARRDAAEAARKEVQAHAKAQPAKKTAAPVTAPTPTKTVGAAGFGPAKTRTTKATGRPCGQRTADGGTCKRVVTTVPCPKHPQGRPAGAR